MFCNQCGSPNPDNSKFCTKCGAGLADLATSPDRPPAAPAQQPRDERPKHGGGFWTSGGGIALIVVLALLVAAGITVGIVFLVKGDPNGQVDAATLKVWDEYASLLEADSGELPPITTDAALLAQAQADLKESQEKAAALKETLEETAGTGQRLQGGETATNRDVKAGELEEALAAYKAYMNKMEQLMAALANANLLDKATVDKINWILGDLKTLGNRARALSNGFLENNEQVAAGKVNERILTFASSAATEIQKAVNNAQAAEAQRLANEKAAADAQAAELERQRQQQQQEQAQLVTCPLCGGVGTIEGGDGRYICPFCGGSGTVTRAKANTFNPADWVP